jgi:RNA polymerase I-specific transcription initiation factor RRN7
VVHEGKKVTIRVRGLLLPDPEMKCLSLSNQELIRALWEQRVNALADKIDDATVTTFEMSMPASEAESEVEDDAIIQTKHLKLDEIPSVIQTVALCYLGIYILRLPVYIGDILRWMKNKWLPYIGAIAMLPPDLRFRLSPVSISYLKDNGKLTAQRLQSKTNHLFMAYQKGLGLKIPHLNVPLCLYRLIEELALPLDIYPAVKKLAGLLQYTFPYPASTGVRWMNTTPDKQLAAFVVVAVKLLYSFDTRIRDPTTATEPGVLIIDWENWRKVRKARQKTLENENIMTHEQAQRLTENEVLHMDEEKIDQYMDWFTENWAKPGEAYASVSEDVFVQAMFKFFPIDSRVAKVTPFDLEKNKEATIQSIHQVHGSLISRAVREPDDSEGSIPSMGRPGTQYLRYRRVEEMDKVAREFYDAVADFVGLPVATLVRCTMSIEIDLGNQKWDQK